MNGHLSDYLPYAGEREKIINLDRIVALIRPELPGVTCYVEQTGGGTATIYLGDSYSLTANTQTVVPFPDPFPEGDYRPVLAGPGWFEGPGWTEGRAHCEDFCIGYDQDFPDDFIDSWDVDGHDERVIARRMVQFYRDHPHYAVFEAARLETQHA